MLLSSPKYGYCLALTYEQKSFYVLHQPLQKQEIDEVINRSLQGKPSTSDEDPKTLAGAVPSNRRARSPDDSSSSSSTTGVVVVDNEEENDSSKDTGGRQDSSVENDVVEVIEGTELGPDDSISRAERSEMKQAKDHELSPSAAEETQEKIPESENQDAEQGDLWAGWGSGKGKGKKKKDQKKRAAFAWSFASDIDDGPGLSLERTVRDDKEKTKKTTSKEARKERRREGAQVNEEPSAPLQPPLDGVEAESHLEPNPYTPELAPMRSRTATVEDADDWDEDPYD